MLSKKYFVILSEREREYRIKMGDLAKNPFAQLFPSVEIAGKIKTALKFRKNIMHRLQILFF